VSAALDTAIAAMPAAVKSAWLEMVERGAEHVVADPCGVTAPQPEDCKW
jgi:hypothetical protein